MNFHKDGLAAVWSPNQRYFNHNIRQQKICCRWSGETRRRKYVVVGQEARRQKYVVVGREQATAK